MAQLLCAGTLLAGCASPGVTAIPAAEVRTDGPDTSASKPPSPVPQQTISPPTDPRSQEEPYLGAAAPGPRQTPDPPQCGDDQLAIGFGVIDAALGHRYLVVQVLNCDAVPVDLPVRPEVVARGGEGEAWQVNWEAREPLRPLVLPAGATAQLMLHWRSSGRCERGAFELDVYVHDQLGTVRDCLQLGGLEDVTGEAAAGDMQWIE